MVVEGVSVPPLLRWAGSKRQQLRHLLPLLPQDAKRYIEPFAGSACLYWALAPEVAILSDLNEDLISLYQHLRLDPKRVYDAYAGLTNSPDQYYRIRSELSKQQDRFVRAGQLLYLNRFCFNGLYRTDRFGNFNVPYGGSKTGSLPTLEQLQTYANRLDGVSLFASDFERVVSTNVRDGDVVYLDPPFFTSASRVFVSYTAKLFDGTDIDRLDRVLKQIHDAGARFIVSYLDNADIRPVAAKWRRSEFAVRRRMSGFASGRRNCQEVVFTNYAA